jgi:hypothetical protein
MMHLDVRAHLIVQRLKSRVRRLLVMVTHCAAMAALLGFYANAAAQDSYGRLFFSSEERRMMNDARNDWVEPSPVQVKRGETVSAPVVDVISFDGKVERSGSRGSTIWVNGRPVLAGNTTVEGIGVNPSRGTSGETVFVLPPSDAGETNFSLKVGQKIAVQSGKVLDSYERRAAEDAESVFAADKVPESDAGAGGGDPAQQNTAPASGAPKPPVIN